MTPTPTHARAMSPALLLLLLAGCAAPPPPAPSPVPTPPPAPVAIVMDAVDTLALQGAIRELPGQGVDQVVGWANPDSGKRGAVKVLRDGFDAENRPCREFHSVVVLDKLSQHATGFLCRQADGSWEVVSLREYPLHRSDGA